MFMTYLNLVNPYQISDCSMLAYSEKEDRKWSYRNLSHSKKLIIHYSSQRTPRHTEYQPLQSFWQNRPPKHESNLRVY